jgi:hypothetical protein
MEFCSVSAENGHGGVPRLPNPHVILSPINSNRRSPDAFLVAISLLRYASTILINCWDPVSSLMVVNPMNWVALNLCLYTLSYYF